MIKRYSTLEPLEAFAIGSVLMVSVAYLLTGTLFTDSPNDFKQAKMDHKSITCNDFTTPQELVYPKRDIH